MNGTINPPQGRSPFHMVRYNVKLLSSLTVRAFTVRFGSEVFELMWAFAEPALFLAMFIAARTYARDSVVFGDSQILFMATGLLTLRMCRGIASKAIPAIKRNKTLLDSPVVHPLDIILAALFVEIFLWAAIVTVFYSAIAYYLDERIIYHHAEFGQAMAASCFFALTLGIFNCVVGTLLPVWLTFWRLTSLPIMMTSGLFFVPSELPQAVIDIISWNPFLHCLEWVRQATYLDYHSILDSQYLLTVSFILLFISITVEYVYRDRLHKE